MKFATNLRRGKQNSRFNLRIFLFFCLSIFLPVFPTDAEDEIDKFFEMSLTDLLDVEVTSVSKTSERRQNAAAAIYVITQDDIKRSSANSIPALLRTVPGIHVARIDANTWSVSSRGFGGAFAKKLLVLIDGRSVYTPFFSGVYWDVQDVMLEDVDRIEVIRGPGGSLWGANAVNGVINIVTKKTSETQGGLLSAGIGTEERAFSSIRYGWSDKSAETFYRVYAKALARDSAEDIVGSGQGDDEWAYGRLGFRMDKQLSISDFLTIQGDYYNSKSDNELSLTDLTTFDRFSMKNEAESEGANILGRWSREHSDQSEFQLQWYWDYYNRDDVLHGEQRHTWDIEFQHSYQLNESNQLVWGLGYRGTISDHENTAYIAQNPSSTTQHIFNIFLQDQIELTNTLKLTLGTKIEHNDFSGFEFQPNARIAWAPTEKYTVWGAISRAVRTPNESENNLFPLGLQGSTGSFVFVYGDNSTKSEELTSYEAGVRAAITKNTMLDVSAYYNDYKDLSSVVLDPTITTPAPAPAVRLVNQGAAEIYGFEAVLDWKAMPRWSLQFVYSYAEANYNSNTLAEDQNLPEQQFSIKNYVSLTDSLELDATIRYVDHIPGAGIGVDIDDYLTGDIRLAWSPKEDLTLEIVGRNLFGPSHSEFNETIVPFVSTEVERGIFGKITWKF
jgi:iron complex outermembrane receptor protein